MTPPMLSQLEKNTWTANIAQRRSMRILLSVPVTIDGKIANRGFCEETRTLVVNAHGALISLAAGVTNGQTITMSNGATRDSRDCRIVYVGSPQAGRSQLGVEFLEPSSAFWQLDFPPDDWVAPEK